jgi:hypothetical protein
MHLKLYEIMIMRVRIEETQNLMAQIMQTTLSYGCMETLERSFDEPAPFPESGRFRIGPVSK